MYNGYKMYPYPYYVNIPMYNSDNKHKANKMYQCPYFFNTQMNNSALPKQLSNQHIPFIDKSKDGVLIELKDYGSQPFVVNIEQATKQNNTFRTALWTGKHLQLTLMSIEPGEDIGLEVHPNIDQFIRIEEGQGVVKMGDSKHNLDFQRKVYDDYAIFIPAGTWHNLINTGKKPIKLYSIYAPPEHPYGTIHETKKDAEENHRH